MPTLSWAAEVQMWWRKAPLELNWNSHWRTLCQSGKSNCSSVAPGPGNFVPQSLICLPMILPPLCLLTSLSFKKSSAPFTGGRGTLQGRERSLRCDASKNRHVTVNINNQTEMWLSKLGNSFLEQKRRGSNYPQFQPFIFALRLHFIYNLTIDRTNSAQ